MGDLGSDFASKSIDNTTLKSDDIAYPCGLIAKYYFTDTFAIY